MNKPTSRETVNQIASLLLQKLCDDEDLELDIESLDSDVTESADGKSATFKIYQDPGNRPSRGRPTTNDMYITPHCITITVSWEKGETVGESD